uniref:Protein kinase domain-containing protein n=1 Tax=Rhizophora mucronata TaxID=61149 RepID=A0A2P2JWA4_RHIMU
MERDTNDVEAERFDRHKKGSYNSREPGHDGFQLLSQACLRDRVSSGNANVGLPDLNGSKAKPVLNFSIQTGEEFALEFMRDRVNPKKPFIPNAGVNPNCATSYMELKGILGISHTGSESESDISMLTMVENGPREVEGRNSSLYDEKSNYGSIQSVPWTSSGYESRGVINGHGSAAASDSFSKRMKVLCSFGGKILPRPSDRKLRYVGGETRIMRITRDISFQQLKQKILAIYSEAHVMKYQLAGEDLDALVSVSCDEDLLNMMEEWNEVEVEDRGGSQKLRMFLFSMKDLEDAQFSMGSIEGDSEMQFVFAVNGMDMGSQRSVIMQDAENSSGNKLAELDRSSIDREMSQVSTVSVGISTSPLTGTFHSSQPTFQNSSNAYETYAQFYPGQIMDHIEAKQLPLHHGYKTSNYSPLGEFPYSTTLHGLADQHRWMNEWEPHNGFQLQDSHFSGKDVKPTSDPSVQQAVDAEMTRPPGKVYPVPLDEVRTVPMPEGSFEVQNSHVLVNEVKATPDPSIQLATDAEKVRPLENAYLVPVDDISVAVSIQGQDAYSLSPKTDGKYQQTKVSSCADATNTVPVPKSSLEDDQDSTSSSVFGPGHADPLSNPTDLSYLEPSLLSQRGYYSERIPREQAELLNRLSKSDDTFDSQFLISHADIAEQIQITESVENLHQGNLVAQTEPSVLARKLANADIQTIHDGLGQHQKNKNFTDPASHMKTKVSDSEAVLECGSKLAVPCDVDAQDSEKRVRVLSADYEIDNGTANLKKVVAEGTGEAGCQHPVTAQAISVMDHKDSVPDDHNCRDSANNDIARDNNVGHLELPKKHGGIQIDIYDRFPRDLFSDIFSKGIFTEDGFGFSPAHKEGAGVSVNMENHEPKHWSYFQKLAQEELVQKVVSPTEQDHIGAPSAFMKVENGNPQSYLHMPLTIEGVSLGHQYSRLKFGQNNQNDLPGIRGAESTMLSDFDDSKVKEPESMQFDAVIENPKSPESQYEDENLVNRNIGLPPFDPSLVDFDVNTLQIIKNEDLEELRELGSGSFGTVYHGKWRGTDVAIKRLKKICFTGRSSEQERLILEFWHEAEILSTLHHPNVLAFYGVVQDGPEGTLATVTEYMVDGSLRHVLLQKDR